MHLWNSRAESHPVGAEFIIMDKVGGGSTVPSLGKDEITPEASSASCHDTSPEAMAKRSILTLRQLVLHRRRAATSRQPICQGWRDSQRFRVCYWADYRPGLD